MTGHALGQRKRLPLWPFLLVLAVGLLLAARFDLPFSRRAYDPEQEWAIAYESFFWYPVALGPGLLLALLPWRVPPARRAPAMVAGYAGLALLLAVLLYVSHGYVQQRFADAATARLFFWQYVLEATLAVAACAIVVARAGDAAKRKLWLVGCACLALAVAQLVLAQGLKLLWARTRFDDMLLVDTLERMLGLAGMESDPGTLARFTPWYRPFGNGGSSFPSAHTANAACVLGVTLLCDVSARWQKWRALVYAVCWWFIGGMGLSRVVMGRHFLSDVLAGAALTALLLYGIRRSKPYKKALGAIQTSIGDGL